MNTPNRGVAINPSAVRDEAINGTALHNRSTGEVDQGDFNGGAKREPSRPWQQWGCDTAAGRASAGGAAERPCGGRADGGPDSSSPKILDNWKRTP